MSHQGVSRSTHILWCADWSGQHAAGKLKMIPQVLFSTTICPIDSFTVTARSRTLLSVVRVLGRPAEPVAGANDGWPSQFRFAGVRFSSVMAQLRMLGVAVTRFGLRGRPPSFALARAAAVFAALLACPPLRAAFRSQSGYWFFIRRTVRRFRSSPFVSAEVSEQCRGFPISGRAVQPRFQLL